MAGGDDLASGISASVFSKTEARPEVATESRGEVDGSASFESPPAQFLLVDDNPVNIRILAAYMSKLHYSFETAMDGQQAIDAFRQGAGHYKCIFMDISMPVMDGFEAARRIRAWEAEMKTPRCHIFALTGLASKGAQQEAFASGIDLFLTKPVRLTELTQILATRGIT
jgi:CheY-like chemotaxis protein